MVVSLMVLALAAGNDPQGVIATARPVAPPVPVEAVAPSDAVGPQTTVASATPHNLTTDQQIARWVSRRQPGEPVFDEGFRPSDDRKMHGEVRAGIGTGGYRDVGVWMSLPIGQIGRLDISYDKTENAPYPYYRDPRWLNRFDDPHGLWRRNGPMRGDILRDDPFDRRGVAQRGLTDPLDLD